MDLTNIAPPQKARTHPDSHTSLSPLNDQALVRACLDGDETAWNALVEKYGRLVYYIAHRYKLDAAQVDDVFQTVFVIVLRRLSSLKQTETFVSWLMTIANREALRASMANHRFVELDEAMIDGSEPPLEQIHREYLAQQVHRALAELDEFSREFITTLMAEPPPSYKELAARFGLALGSIGPTRERCLRKLEATLKRMGVELP